VEILDIIEEGDRVAVRWQLTATYDDGKPYKRSIMAIYRFENGRIAVEIPRGIIAHCRQIRWLWQ
jgi:ketosteroid isomerase-like protein